MVKIDRYLHLYRSASEGRLLSPMTKGVRAKRAPCWMGSGKRTRVVTQPHWLARSTKDLLENVEHLNGVSAGPRQQHTPVGCKIRPVFAGMVEIERALSHQRTGAEREKASKRGVKFGSSPR